MVFFLVLLFFLIFDADGCPSPIFSETTIDVIRKCGYVSETHSVFTDDGYELILHRIPPRENCVGVGNYVPVLVMHGIFQSSYFWVFTDCKNALAFLLADLCYDVWLGNLRGNCYSRGHEKYWGYKYWEFSYDEQGAYDVPAMVDYILDVTGQPSCKYIGYSLGTTVFFVALNKNPRLNTAISSAFCLAPVAYLKDSTSFPFRNFAQGEPAGTRFTQTFGNFDFCPTNRLTVDAVYAFCKALPGLCSLGLMACGNTDEEYDKNAVSKAMTYRCGASTRLLFHMGQGYNNLTFSEYKYPARPYTEDYNLARVTVPVYIYHSKCDKCADTKDVNRLIRELPNVKNVTYIDEKCLDHNCFIFCVFLILEVYGCPKETYINNPCYETPQDMIQKAGYDAETHEVESKGYKLVIHRIPVNDSTKCPNGAKGVVILQHGLFFGSAQWLTLGKNYALAFLLAELCYDVWLPNLRGNCYSRNHTTLTTNDDQFWDFSWHEMGYYDLPAVVNHISNETKRSDLIVIAYSQGTTVALVAFSTDPELAKKVKTIILLAPVAYTKSSTYCKYALFGTLGTALTANKALKNFEVCTNDPVKNNDIEKKCDASPTNCSKDFAVCGYNPTPYDADIVCSLLAHQCAGSSKIFLHYSQGCSAETEEESFAWYRNNPFDAPKIYNISLIKTKTHIIYAKNDICGPPSNVQTMKSKLTNLGEFILVNDSLFTHADFHSRRAAKVEVYEHIIKIIEKNSASGTATIVVLLLPLSVLCLYLY